MICFISCTKKVAIETVTVNYKENKAVSISMVSEATSEVFAVYVKGNTTTAVLGNFNRVGKELMFTPVVPFSNGQTYILKQQETALTEFTIESKRSNQPEVLVIYPTTDTVPENLLKLYLVFSKPMQEVQSALDFIEVYNVTDNQQTDVFLSLENELWNAEHTELTLWLDPGRIKTDLIPNRTKGLPIIAGKSYRLRVQEEWKDAEGNTLAKPFEKTYHVTTRDQQRPNVKRWFLKPPKSNSKEPLIISFHEPLDAMLLQEMVQIIKPKDALITGRLELLEQEKTLAFYPDKAWKIGDYFIAVNSKLEDLAGNNLKHLFDRDLKNYTAEEHEGFLKKHFSIE